MHRFSSATAWRAAAVLLIALAAHAPARAAPPPESTWGQSLDAGATAGATGEYFHDFGELILRVRSVEWIAEICGEAFPATAELEAHAYADWLRAHGGFVREMEGQFDLIARRWGELPPALRKEGVDVGAMKARLDANEAVLRADLRAAPAAVFKRRCEAYPAILLSPQLDLEKSQADYVASVRRGP
jgi:hypothetical protein